MLFIASFIEHFIPKNLALLQNIDFFGWLLPAVWGFWSKAVALPRSKSLRLSEGHSFDPGILQPAHKDTKRRLWEWVNALWVVEKYGESLIIPVQAQPVNLKRKSTQNPLCKTLISTIWNQSFHSFWCSSLPGSVGVKHACRLVHTYSCNN